MQRQRADYVIAALDDGIDVLQALADSTELGVTEISRRLGLHKNKAFRLLATLENRGLVQQTADRQYRLGGGCFTLGCAFERDHPVALRARPLLAALAEESGETAHYGVLHELEALQLCGARAPGRRLGLDLGVGQRLPCHATALGKVLLGCGPQSVREIYDRERVAGGGLTRHTPTTIVDRDKLFEQLRTVGAQGWAVDLEEYETGLASVAAPVHGAHGALVGGISVSGPTSRLDVERLEGEILPLVVSAAGQLSRELGHQG